jgi:hypothetical protein
MPSLKMPLYGGVNLSGANLRGADLSGAFFEPSDNPEVDKIAFAKNLSQLQFMDSRLALVKLKKSFKDAGYREKEWEITYAIKHTELHKAINNKDRKWSDLVEIGFQYVFFELTTDWGMVPGRALIILVCLIPIFAAPYTIVLYRPVSDGIWLNWSSDRLRDDLGASKPKLLKLGFLSAVGVGFYFTVLSAFHIGWRDFNVGNWIARLQAREYTLRASGWVRSLSGLQSLISVYLLAIWAVSYFGRPFE